MLRQQHQRLFTHLRRQQGVLRYYSTTVLVPNSNVTQQIKDKIGRNLHLQNNHPLNIIKNRIQSAPSMTQFERFDSIPPQVPTLHNFDMLCFPMDHVGRSMSDTYYIDEKTVLRTHTTAHQVPLLIEGHKQFLITGDVYRRDDIDATHYPVFHQMDGVKVFKLDECPPDIDVAAELKKDLEDVIKHLFGDRVSNMKWIDEYFPFTEPSFELEIEFNGQWLEVLGSGLVRHDILRNAGLDPALYRAYAFGLGLERLAMILFDIQDIRLFWSKDDRFLNQFKKITGNMALQFKPYSKYPVCYKDISCWLPENFHDNDLYELVRNICGDIVESVKVVSSFVHPKTNRLSKCYRVNYRHMDRSLTNEEIDQLQFQLRKELEQQLKVELR
jgi:phenylalanyl-tRNA synthetase alpha chain